MVGRESLTAEQLAELRDDHASFLRRVMARDPRALSSDRIDIAGKYDLLPRQQSYHIESQHQ